MSLRFSRLVISFLVAVAVFAGLVAPASAAHRKPHLRPYSTINSAMRRDAIGVYLTYNFVDGTVLGDMSVTLFQGSGIPKGVNNPRDNVLSYFALQFLDGSYLEVGTKQDQYGYRVVYYDDLGVICAAPFVANIFDSTTGAPTGCIGPYDNYLGSGQDVITLSYDGAFYHPHVWNVLNESPTEIGMMGSLGDKTYLPAIVTEEAWIDTNNPWLNMGTNWRDPMINQIPWYGKQPLAQDEYPVGIFTASTQSDNPCDGTPNGHYSLQPIGSSWSPPDPMTVYMGTPLGGWAGPWMCSGTPPGWGSPT